MTSERRTEPPPSRLHPSQNHLVLPSELKCRRLDGFPVSVAHSLATGVHLEPLDLLGITERILTSEILKRVLRCG